MCDLSFDAGNFICSIIKSEWYHPFIRACNFNVNEDVIDLVPLSKFYESLVMKRVYFQFRCSLQNLQRKNAFAFLQIAACKRRFVVSDHHVTSEDDVIKFASLFLSQAAGVSQSLIKEEAHNCVSIRSAKYVLLFRLLSEMQLSVFDSKNFNALQTGHNFCKD